MTSEIPYTLHSLVHVQVSNAQLSSSVRCITTLTITFTWPNNPNIILAHDTENDRMESKQFTHISNGSNANPNAKLQLMQERGQHTPPKLSNAMPFHTKSLRVEKAYTDRQPSRAEDSERTIWFSMYMQPTRQSTSQLTCAHTTHIMCHIHIVNRNIPFEFRTSHKYQRRIECCLWLWSTVSRAEHQRERTVNDTHAHIHTH